MRSVSILAIGTLAYRAMAQTASFRNMTWGQVAVATVWPIGWTPGDETPVSLLIGNDTWQWKIFENEPALLGEYDWTVAVPEGVVVPGLYHLGLVQSNEVTASPLFELVSPSAGSNTTTAATDTTTTTADFPTLTPMANATLIDAPVEPNVTMTTYWDHSCGCQTSAVVTAPRVTPGSNCTTSAMAGGNVPLTPTSPSTWATAESTAEANAEAEASAQANAGANAEATTSLYTGKASKMMSSGFGIVALIAAGMLA